MSINNIEVKNYKSIKYINLELNTLNCIIGENGSGKSNILKALKYFYDNLTKNNANKSIFDKQNPYSHYVEISVKYDFSNILKIIQEREQIDNTLNPYFADVLALFNYKSSSEYTGTEVHIITATLQQYKKDNSQKWNIPYETRKLLKSIFPIYHIDARHINLTDWDNLWDSIGDICKVQIKEQDAFENDDQEFTDINIQNKVAEALEYIKSEFRQNDINLHSFTNKQKLIHLFQLQLKGKEFKHLENDLEYFSDGTNSYNYLRLLINLLIKITPSKAKNSLLIIDEPEIGLHPKFIDSLVESFTSVSDPIRIMFTTHSSRIVKDMVSSGANSVIHHTTMRNEYTIITKVNDSKDNRQTNVITETEASCYFAKCILFYEGDTENELFNNKNLKNMFSILKNIELYSFKSNNVGVKIIHPSNKNLKIPFLVLIDMDKIIAYKNNEFKYVLKRDELINPLFNKEIERKEKLLYGKRRVNTLNVRKQIIGYCDKTNFIFNEYGFSDDAHFYDLKKLIKRYCKNYDIYPVSTTIEGGLINKDNIEIVFNWMINRIAQGKGNLNQKADYRKKLESIYNMQADMKYKVTVLRLLHEGKSDNLLKYKNIGNNNLELSDSFKKAYHNMKWYNGEKTSGWVSEFINYFFENYVNESVRSDEEKVEIFKMNFEEIYDIIRTIENKCKY